MTKQRVVVGLSGGVDSAVTAHLLKQQGHEVVGIFMKNWEDDDDSEYCSSNIDFVDAASVADVLGIEIEHVNFAADYKDRVFAEFLREYQAGRTPNPDVLCNAEIKFKAFLDHAMRLGAEKIATGHYARVRLNAATGLHELLKGLDPSKDQSYFLHRLNQAQLSKALFPVGELHKSEVRRIATEIGLPVAAMDEYVRACKAALSQRLPGAFALFYGHIGDGNLHIVAGLKGASPQPKDVIQEVVYGLVREFGGTVSAEHGIGLTKKPWLGHVRSEAEIALMRRLKAAMDPNGVLNPGKVV